MSTAEPPDEPGPRSPGEGDAGEGAPGATWSAATSDPLPPPPPPPVAATDVVTDSWSPPPTPPKRKLTWLWILIGALVLIAALVVVAVVLFIRTLAGPIDATNDVLARIKNERYAAAYNLSCAADRELYTLEQYQRIFENAKDAQGAIESYDVNYSSVHGDEADVRYNLEFAGGATERYEATARKEGGKWHACLFPPEDR